MTHLKFSSKFDFQEDFLKEDFTNRFSKNSPVVIKMHFGEPGNPNAFTKEDIKSGADKAFIEGVFVLE